jgi:hypothetical protein
MNGYYSENLVDASTSIDSVTNSGYLSFLIEFRSTILRTEQTLRAFYINPCTDRNSVLIRRCHLMNEMSV